MEPIARALLFLPLLALLLPGAALAQSDCTKETTDRAVAGGEKLPTLVVHCSLSESAQSVEADAPCESADELSPGFREACELALARAAASHQAAKIRRALRAGQSPDRVAEATDASLAEVLVIQDSMEAR